MWVRPANVFFRPQTGFLQRLLASEAAAAVVPPTKSETPDTGDKAAQGQTRRALLTATAALRLWEGAAAPDRRAVQAQALHAALLVALGVTEAAIAAAAAAPAASAPGADHPGVAEVAAAAGAENAPHASTFETAESAPARVHGHFEAYTGPEEAEAAAAATCSPATRRRLREQE